MEKREREKIRATAKINWISISKHLRWLFLFVRISITCRTYNTHISWFDRQINGNTIFSSGVCQRNVMKWKKKTKWTRTDSIKQNGSSKRRCSFRIYIITKTKYYLIVCSAKPIAPANVNAHMCACICCALHKIIAWISTRYREQENERERKKAQECKILQHGPKWMKNKKKEKKI